MKRRMIKPELWKKSKKEVLLINRARRGNQGLW